MPARIVLVAALAIACHGVMAQTESVSTVPVPLAVQRLAPQLIAFAGSEANFQNLVNGLANGTPVQLTTTLSNGFSQTVTFTPSALGSPAQIAQILEAARQQLIGLGIGAPTAEQIGFTLMGGLVPTPLGGTQVSGLANAQATNNPPSRAAQMQQQAGAGASAATTAPSITSAVNVQTTPTAATTTTTVGATRQTSDSLIAPGTTSRSTAPVVSASPAFNTSASPAVNTSTSPSATTPNPAPGAGSVPPATERVPATARPARN
jgi:hypothetical protein